MRRALLLTVALAFFAGCNAYCNRRVFEQVEPTCDQTIAEDVDIPAEKASDILIVVDNSGSMQEEQTRLAAAFINESAACPINKNDLKSFADCKDDPTIPVCRFANPSPEVLAAPAPDGLRDCGFIQVLAAFENDFRIGVITTDIGVCDNRLPDGQANLFCGDGRPGDLLPECGQFDGIDWGFRPQRGCLQPNGPPGTNLKVIARADLDDADPANDEIGQRFIDTLSNIRTFGSSIERGLDAMKIFLDPASDRASGCEGDLDAFLREDAKLIVIFLTDEEDCSRLDDVGECTGSECADCDNGELGCEIFSCTAGQTCELGITEFTNEVCGEFPLHFSTYPAARCYDNVDDLTSPGRYVDFLKGLKGDVNDVSVAVIAGGLPGAEPGEITPAGCSFNAANGQVPVGDCKLSQGQSNSAVVCPASENCCIADPGSRYYDVATGMNGLKDTICVDSFGQTMIKIAVFIADVDFVKLAEKPENPALIFVEKAPAGVDEFETIARINATVCGAGDGWVLEDDGLTVRFCGTARPGAGERVRVRAKGQGAADADGAEACVGRGE
ncbi:MAG: hypothetical protein Q8O67_12510 [Deltaproteobacteria bacterium]|nr:hypothetical protein [Deltaproteobacteria bacterium]